MPRIGLPANVNGRDVGLYFTSHEEADAAVVDQRVIRALELAGAWCDLDWDEVRSGLERIRRESSASPPLQLSDD